MLDLRQLRHFVAVARHLHYIRAADELGITQPTLTRSIQVLERQLGTRLFDRDRGGVALTPQGQQLAERAKLLLIDAENVERETRSSAGGQSGRIRFGMAPMPARALLSGALSERIAAAPSVVHEVVVRDVEALWAMLMTGELEFFISSERPRHDLSLAHVERLGTFPLSIVVRAGHPLLTGALPEARFPILRSSWGGISIPDEIKPRLLAAPNIIEDFGTLENIVRSTDAMWFVSSRAITADLESGDFVEYMRTSQSVELLLYALARRSRSPLAEFTLTALRHGCVSLHAGEA